MSELLYGLDPSLTHFGYAIAVRGTRGDGVIHTRFEAVGVLVPSKPATKQQRKKRGIGKTEDTTARMAELANGLRDVVGRHGAPSRVAVEAVAFKLSTRATFLALGRARGLVDALCAEHGVAVEEFQPQALKKAVTGRNDAEKADVINAVVQLYPELEALFDQLSESNVEHAADACAALHVALTQEHHHAEAHEEV